MPVYSARGRRLRMLLVTVVLLFASSSRMDAALIFFANGRTLSVKDYRLDGPRIVVTLRHGGEASFSADLIARIEPDELPAEEVVPEEDPTGPPPGLKPTPSVLTQESSKPPSDQPEVAIRSLASLASRPYAGLIDRISRRHGVDPALVHAVVQVESNYKPGAQSEAGARGLMQMMPTTASEFGIVSARMLLDPQANLEAGVKYLKFLLSRFTLDEALAAYNAGPAAVRRFAGIPPFPETRNYVKKVLAGYAK